MRIISKDELQEEMISVLGLGTDLLSFDSREILAAMVRRAAGFLCPCPSKSLIDAVTQSLRYIVQSSNDLDITVRDVVEELIAIGDLQEFKNVALNSSALLYLAPPSYVCLSNDMVIILGITPDNVSFLPENVEQMLVSKGCLRFLRKEPLSVCIGSRVSVCDVKGNKEDYVITTQQNTDPSSNKISVDSPVGKALLDKTVGDNVEVATPSEVRMLRIVNVANQQDHEEDDGLLKVLCLFGLTKYPEDNWLKFPPDETSEQYVSHFNRALINADQCGDIPGLTILDPEKDVRYYPGRWSKPKSLSGNFLGRRPQAYGNDIWCYITLKKGKPEKLLDLPLPSSTTLRGCDEAWRLQSALDAQLGKPQLYRLRKTTTSNFMMDIFSPIPNWMARRWNWIGNRIKSDGCLMSFEFAKSDIEREVEFARRKLWLDNYSQ